MSRPRAIVLISAIVLFTIGGVLALAAVLLTRTAWGREEIRSTVEGMLNARIKGKIHLGHLSGSLASHVVVDSLELRETNDSLFLASGPIELEFDVRDLFDRRILVRRARFTRPVVRIEQDSTGTWNFRKIFPSGPKGPPSVLTQRKFGDFVDIDSAVVTDLHLRVTMPWHAPDSLRGARRDSAVAFALGRPDKEIRRVGSQFGLTREWTRTRLELSHARVDDHDTLGRDFDITRLDADEFDPPFRFRDARGHVRWDGDSLWLNIEHFTLPGSRGSAEGKVWWGSGLPTRYDVSIAADTVSMADIAWVYPTLPTTGGGRLKLRIQNERDVRIIDYVLSDMDVRTTESHLRGDMTFGVGGPVLLVKNVKVRADPLDFAFLHRINGKPLPYAWRGTLTGTLRASGGPVNAFRVDSTELMFRDANVPGATAHVRARGGLNILFPAFTVFQGFDLALDAFDLRTIQFLNPLFPRYDGIISGHARLDSSWLDLRFRDADITHRFGEGAPNHFTGNGRVTFGERFLTYDLALDASPISFGTVARAYREYPIPYRGEYNGPMRLQGTLEDLDVSTELHGAAGMLGYDGRVDADSVNGYAGHGSLRFGDLDLRTLFDTAAMPRTALNGHADIELVGDSLATLVGTLGVELDRSFVDSLRLYGGRARLRFGGRRVVVDSAHVDAPAATLLVQGALGLSAEVRDSLSFSLMADSLGGFRRLLARLYPSDSAGRVQAATDSMAGRVTVEGALTGSLDSLALLARVVAEGASAAGYGGRSVRVEAMLEGVTGATHGTVTLLGDSVLAAGLHLSTMGARLTVDDPSHLRYDAEATMSRGPVVSSTGMVLLTGDTATTSLSRFDVTFPDHAWHLVRPAVVVSSNSGFRLDSIALVGSAAGQLSIRGESPVTGTTNLALRADSVPLSDLGQMAQLPFALGGVLNARLDIGGTRLAPLMTFAGAVQGGAVGEVNLDRMGMSGRYAAGRATVTMDVVRDGARVLEADANLPMDLRLESTKERMRNDTMRVTLRSRDVDLKVLESFVPSLRDATGRLNADLSLHGPPARRSLEGFLRIEGGAVTVDAMGERLRDIAVNVTALRDTLRVERFTVVSGAARGDSLWLGGHVALVGRDSAPEFRLTLGASNFHALARPRIADLEISANLSLIGPQARPEVTGGVTLERGVIRIPEFIDKELVDLNDPLLYNIIDTTVYSNRTLLSRAPSSFVQKLSLRNVQLAMGSNVRLLSSESNIALGGSVSITVGRRAGGPAQIALDGALQTRQGTYVLDFGPALKRTFQIEGGNIRFLGDPDLNPLLDIRAVHTVRQISGTIGARNDLRVRVRVQGTLLQPRVTLESADSLALSESDLISYLVTGAQSFTIGSSLRENTGRLQSIVVGSFGSILTQLLAGRLFDYVQVQAATDVLTQGGANSSAGTALYNGVQLGIGKQITDRTSFFFETGLCNARNQSGSALDAVGFKVEHRLKQGYGVSLSREPGTQRYLCSLRSFAPTPPQFGLDLYRAWRF